MMQFNQQQAIEGSQSSGGNYNSQVVDVVITEAKWTQANSGAQALEMTVQTREGQEFKYLSLYYTKRDGSQNDVGYGQIQAIMGVTGVQNLSNQNGVAPELNGKQAKLALERENYIKGNGEEGFRFSIKAAMSVKSGQTYAEFSEGKEPKDLEYWTKRFSDNPQGVQAKGQQMTQVGNAAPGYGGAPQGSQHSAPAQGAEDDFDDEIPFN